MPAELNIPTRLETPKGLRIHIGLFGRRNAGKSSLINALTNQQIAIVSDVPGTTTDPVEKACELAPVGPVVFIDTAGIDDVGKLGHLRTDRTMSVLGWMDLALIVCDAAGITDYEKELFRIVTANKTPAIVVLNKTDLHAPEAPVISTIKSFNLPFVSVSASEHIGIDTLLSAIIRTIQEETEPDRPMMEGLISPGDTVLMVTPIDTGAPKGRMILPQVQAIRETLDSDALCLTVRENRVAQAISQQTVPPKFVITDSQVFAKVSADTPADIMLTSFSILFARYKGNLPALIKGVPALEQIEDGDKILVSEGCTHHRQCDDIGTVKIPRWLKEYTGKELIIETSSGTEFPDDLGSYKMIIHCGGCMLNEREMQFRQYSAEEKGVPYTNYGILIAYINGILKRSLAPFDEYASMI